MAHIFISYSRKDVAYVRTLANALLERGFDVWFDEQIDYGDNWEQAIFQAIGGAGAVMVVMSPAAAASAWVPREIAYAEDQRKPIFPVLLAGDIFPRLILTQFADVRSGGLPGDDFFATVAQTVAPRSERGQQIRFKAASPPHQEITRGVPRIRTATRERRLESAVPRQSTRGVPTEVRVKISRLDAIGLRGELPDLTEYGDEIRKDDVRASTFPLAFPVRPDGTLAPVNMCIQVSAEHYEVAYPANACGEGAAPVEIDPDHDSRTIIFSLNPVSGAYLGRSAVTVRLVHEGQVIAENRVITRIVEQLSETAYTLAGAAVGVLPPPAPIMPMPVARPAAPPAPASAPGASDMAAPTVKIDTRRALTAEAAPAPAPMPPAKGTRRRGSAARYAGLFGILLAGIVGVLVLSQSQPMLIGTSVQITANAGEIPTTFFPLATRAVATEEPITSQQTVRAVVELPADGGRTAAYTGSPADGFERSSAPESGTAVTVVTQAQVAGALWLEVDLDNDERVWVLADDVRLTEGSLSDVPTWVR